MDGPIVEFPEVCEGSTLSKKKFYSRAGSIYVAAVFDWISYLDFFHLNDSLIFQQS